jgi:hypothetical protein
MKTSELITKLQELDPSGEMVCCTFDRDDYHSHIQFVDIEKVKPHAGGLRDLYSDDENGTLEIISII